MKHKILGREMSNTSFSVSIFVFLLMVTGAVGAWAYSLGNVKYVDAPQTETAVLGQTSEVDQAAYNTDPMSYEPYQYNGYYREQSFIPTLDTLTKVNLTLNGANFNGNTPLRLAVLTPGKAIIAEKTIYPTFTQMWGTDFVFSSPVTLTPGNTYYLRLEIMNETDNSFIYWYTCGNTYANGSAFESGTPSPYDFAFITYGYNYQEPAPQTPAPATPSSTPNSTTGTSTATTKAAATTAAAPVAAPNVLAMPLNFKVDRNQDEQIVFSWDKNKEADLAGYVLYVYEAQKETELEIIDINDKELDNYNLALADHPKMSLDKEYDVKLAAKNTAGAVSEKTHSIRVKFNPKAKATVAVKSEKSWLSNPYVLGGLGLLLVALVGLLVFLEKKYHGLGKLFKKEKSQDKATKN